MKYDIDYFIKKFKAIPSKKWTVGELTGDNNTHCALGHCESSSERRALCKVLRGCTASINDALFLYGELGKTPRTRILRALKNLKKNGSIW